MENTSLNSSIKLLSFSLFLSLSSFAFAGPTGETVVSGDITVTRPTSTATQVTQATDKGIINWQDFSIGANESVAFHQPGATSITLNRVTGTNPSSILGQLTANGQIILINRAGVLFGANARVDVAGLIATTANMTNADFNSGLYRFTSNQNDLTLEGQILNQGKIQAQEGGAVVLVAPNVTNEGLIVAKAGKVALGSGSAYTVDLAGDQLLQFTVDPTQMNAVNAKGEAVPVGVYQAGQVFADGGSVLLSTQAAHESINQVISHTGITEAKTLQNKGGKIILSGGAGTQIQVSGQLTATGEQAGQKGGTIKILAPKISVGTTVPATLNVSGKAGGGTILVGGNLQGKGPEPNAQQVTVGTQATLQANATDNGNGGTVVAYSEGTTAFHGAAEAKGGPNGGNGGMIETSGHDLDIHGAKVNASAPQGDAGTWLLDPADFTVDTSAASALVTALVTGTTANVQADNSIHVNAEIHTDNAVNGAWLYLNSGGTIDIAAPITGNFGLDITAGGIITPTSDANISVRDFALHGGTWNQIHSTLPQFSVSNSFSFASNAQFKRFQGGSGTASDPYQVTDVYGLQGIGSSSLLNGSYALVNDIDASGTATWNGGLGFAPIGATNASVFGGKLEGNHYRITGLHINRPTEDYVGLFGHVSNGSIQNLTLAGPGTVIGRSSVGAFMGESISTTLTNVHNYLSVAGQPTVVDGDLTGGNYIGGLVGTSPWVLNGTMTTINQSSNSGNIEGFNSVGGLIGGGNFKINQSFNEGTITGTNSLGGLVGYALSDIFFPTPQSIAEIKNSYNKGNIFFRKEPRSKLASMPYGIGGLLGFAFGANIEKSYNQGKVIGGDNNTTSAFSVGGVMGMGMQANIRDSYNIGSVTVSGVGDSIGGIVGSIDEKSTITNSYQSGKVQTTTDSTNVGAFVGKSQGTIRQSFFDKTVTGSTLPGVGSGSEEGLVGVDTQSMTKAATFSGWDFASVWGIREGSSYPYLLSIPNPFYPGVSASIDPVKVFPEKKAVTDNSHTEKDGCKGVNGLSWKCLKLNFLK